jgi:hypothetical protein
LTIGRATAGSYEGLCGGKKKKVVLPNSHFEILIPLHASHWIYSSPATYEKGWGLPPDIEVTGTIDDFLSGKDLCLELALHELANGLRRSGVK